MNSETKNCQSCKKDFTIEPDDFAFYQKISVPPPTWCPECRLIRRMSFRNERGLHRRICDATKKGIVSIYRPDAPFTVYAHDYWWSDKWDPMQYGMDYDFSRPFFEQFKELMRKTPTIALFDSKSTNSSYCNVTVEHKNCYLSSAGWGNEDSMYMNRTAYCKNAMDLYVCQKNEFAYENIFCKGSYELFYSDTCEGCNNSAFLYDCRACSNCFGCVNLRSQEYCIFNQKYSKEEYAKKLKEFDLGNYATLQEIKKKVDELKKTALHKYAQIVKSVNAIGDHLTEARNVYYCFDFMDGAENVKYSHWSSGVFKDSYDTGPGTGGNSELLYEGVSIGVTNANCKFGFIVWYSQNVQYGFNCQSSNNLFGCANMRGKSYCILNKQYSKEAYEALIPKIIQHMNDMPYVDSKGRVYKYGEFFPPELSPFPYNDTVAQDFFPLTKAEAQKRGFSYGDSVERQYKITKNATELPNHINDVQETIVNEVIECAHKGACGEGCTTAFRITPTELIFYKKFNLALPRLCFACRHRARLNQRTPLKLWHRTCRCAGEASEGNAYKNTAAHFHAAAHCPNTFETSYAPDRPEIVYCEQCYQAEVV